MLLKSLQQQFLQHKMRILNELDQQKILRSRDFLLDNYTDFLREFQNYQEFDDQTISHQQGSLIRRFVQQQDSAEDALGG